MMFPSSLPMSRLLLLDQIHTCDFVRGLSPERTGTSAGISPPSCITSPRGSAASFFAPSEQLPPLPPHTVSQHCQAVPFLEQGLMPLQKLLQLRRKRRKEQASSRSKLQTNSAAAIRTGSIVSATLATAERRGQEK
jgi:hypothetical protein